MRWLATVRSVWRSLFERRRTEADLDDEMRDHLEQEIDSNLRTGMLREEAEFAARRLLGSVSLYKEECRDARGIGWIEAFARDLRYGARMLRRTPLFTAIATVTLALGIGANTTVFTFVDNILLRPLPVRNPQQLMTLNWGEMVNFSYPNYLDFRDRSTAFANLAAERFNPVNMSLRARENFRVWGYEVTGNYFGMLGVAPELGRFFGASEDDKPGANPVVVLSDRYWRRHFAADPRAVGQSIEINDYSFTVIGIAPPSFLGTERIVSADYWVPITMETQIEPGNDWLTSRGSQEVWVSGRLRAGATRAVAEADLDRIARELARAHPNEVEPGAKFRLSPSGLVGEVFRGPIISFGIAFMSIAGMTLLLACINLAGMLLARGSDRHREVGIRLAVGASRIHLLRQLMLENLLLAGMGGLLGLAISFGACTLFSSWHPDFDLPVRTAIQPDAGVLVFTLVATVLTTLLFGLAPALQAVRTDLIPSLKDEPLSSRFRRLTIRDLLVAAQIAISMILLISSVLVVRSLQHALTLNLGFRPEGAVSVSFDLSLQRYTPERSRRLDAELLKSASTLPGLESVGLVSNLPLRIGESNDVVTRADRPVPKRSDWRGAVVYKISPGYLKAAGTRLLRGRDINSHDRQGTAPVVIVNEAAVRWLYGKENPLGKHLRLDTDPRDRGAEIIGVVETGKYESLGENPKPAVFLPIAQSGTGWTTLVARSSLPAQQATELLRKAVLDLDPELTLFNGGSLEDELALPLFPARAAAIVLGVFGLLAMVLAATGLFALMAYSVARRVREIGIRMALGARPRQVLFSVMRRTAVLCAAGICVGTAVTIGTSQLLSAILYGISPRDPLTYVTALLLIIGVALLAAWHPAARAIHVDPARTLREQ